ncbi:MAG TPA: glycosyl hydrolase 108 family protein [Saprospiraceae bacterium]|nr:glycosyl hydrolase 108 family protein [Saprospiraceae bacterium]
MSTFEMAVKYVLDNEGGFSDNPKDRGGATNRGVSLRFLKSLPTEKLRLYGIFSEPNEMTIMDLTDDQTRKIFHGEFWQHAPFEMINDQGVCNYVFSMAIHMGIAPAIKCVQRAIWAISKDRSILKDDGILGSNTLHYINYLDGHIESTLRSECAGDYRTIVARYPEQNEFIDGWLNRAYEQ